MAVLMISDCSLGRFSLVEQDFVAVENQAGERGGILWTDLYWEGDESIIYGALRQRGRRMYSVMVHMDITLRARDGSIRKGLCSGDMEVPGRRVGEGTDWKHFRVRVPRGILEGSTVRMVVRSGSYVQMDIRNKAGG